ncbi:MAG: GSCFA domain-containing protein [Saprospiraceae bacterium]|nr:GSCFA domain-containing protein [Saprospiraceae bacterium]
MDAYYTSLSIPKPIFQIAPSSRILTMGSCFAGHIGDFFISQKFQALVNPTGILFNPESIVQNLSTVLGKRSISEKEHLLVHSDGLWHSLLHHGQFSHTNRDAVISKIDSAAREMHQFLVTADLLIITLGTAHIYRHLKTGEIAANCHKLPSVEFVKELLDINTICKRFDTLLHDLKSFTPGLQVLLTVSPVRYIRDGLMENNQSKATLITVTHKLVKNHENCHYFPAYEILIDELRDYRFYAKDLVHPSQQAIEYILDKFVQTYFNHPAQRQVHEIMALRQALNHRPLHPQSEAHGRFLEKMRTKIVLLKKEYPKLDFRDEEQQLGS